MERHVMETKLEIIGPYTPEHDGPFCTRDGRSVRIICKDKIGTNPIVGLVGSEGYDEFIVMCTEDGFRNTDKTNSRYDFMNAREVPVAREFWVNEYTNGFGPLKLSEQAAKDSGVDGLLRTIHVREVLPGDECNINIVGHIPEGEVWDNPHRVARYMYRGKDGASDKPLVLLSDSIAAQGDIMKRFDEVRDFLAWFSNCDSIRNIRESRKRAKNILSNLPPAP